MFVVCCEFGASPCFLFFSLYGFLCNNALAERASVRTRERPRMSSWRKKRVVSLRDVASGSLNIPAF